MQTETFNNTYINLYNTMNKKFFTHSPTLDSVLMVEEFIHKHSSEYTKYQIWKQLPKKMMYQTFCTIINYLESSNKIMIDKRDRIIIWTWNPERVRDLIKRGLIIK